VAGRTVRIAWELDPISVDRMARLAPDGSAVLRVVAVTGRDGLLARQELDIDAPELRGVRAATDLPRDAVLRVALGWRSRMGFSPLAVGAVYAYRDNGTPALTFAPPGAPLVRYERLLEQASKAE